MSASISTRQLPAAIEVKLRSVRWRHALLAGTRALAIGWCVLIALMMVSLAIDWAFPFMDALVRILLTSSTLIATVITVIALGRQPIRNALGWNHAASAVDDGIPQLQERWSTVASLSARDHSNESSIEKAMAAQVTSEAIAMERIVRPERISPPVSLHGAILAAVAIGSLLAGLIAISPTQMSVLLRRFWSPTSNITATQLTSMTGDQFVPRGETIELVTKLNGLHRSAATLTLRDSEGGEQSYSLRPEEDAHDRFLHAMRVDESVTYRVRSGDGQTQWHSLLAIDFPEIAEVRFSIEFPEYTDRPSVHRDLIPRRVKVVQGSMLDLSIKPLEPLQRLSISLAAPEPSTRSAESDGETAGETTGETAGETEHELVADSEGWYHFRMQLLDDVVLRPTLLSPHGLLNQRRLFSRIEVIADKAPVARVVSPTDEMAVAVDESIEIEFEAHDDHGIATAELVIYDEPRKDADGNPKVVAVKQIPLGDQTMQKHVMGKTLLDLKELNLPEGSEISYAIRVTDNRNVPSAEDVTPDPSLPMSTQIAGMQENDAAARSKSEEPSGTAPGMDITDKSRTPGDSNQPSLEQPDDDSKDKGESSDVLAEISERSGRDPAKDALAEMLKLTPRNSKAQDDGSSAPAEQEGVAAKDKLGDQPKPNESTSDPNKVAADDSSSTETSKESNSPADTAVTRSETSRDPDSDSPAGPEMKEKEKKPSTDAASAVSSLASVSSQKSDNQTSPPPPKFSLEPQRGRSGQNTLTGRRRLKITQRLASIAKADDRPGEDFEVRKNVVAIDEMLAVIETGLRQLLDHAIADADRAEQFRGLDIGLGNVESYVADLREQTKENQFAFVGLQMVDITRTHVTPARDRVFAAIQQPNASDADASVSLQHVVRARELLGALLKRYDRVVQEQKLQQSLDETVTMYEVYVQKRRTLMREARQNLNPLERKMAVVEVDQEYLDRLAEVLKQRREMMDEFAQMLADDPRLLSRYLELVKRRGKSLRDRLSEISQLQYDATEEMLGWLQIDETQKQDLWTIIVELRLHSATDLAKDAAELAQRIEKQMPLEVDAEVGTPAEVIREAKQIAGLARTISFDAEGVMADAGHAKDSAALLAHARSLVARFDRLSASLDRLQFENEGVDAITDYVEPRMLETRTVADQADAWASLSQSVADHAYWSIVETEQQRIAVSTQVLRVEMLDMKSDLDGQFQQLTESPIPVEIVEMIEQLHRLMESITFNQAAASFRAGQKQLDSAARQQQLATDRLVEAEKLFDRIRRAVVDELDEYDVRDPNIADLRDPVLDEFLARLEREPSIAAQLGIPNRRRNLRVIADSIFFQQNGNVGLSDSGDAAAARAKEAMKMNRADEKAKRDKDQEKELSKDEQEQRDEAKKAQEMLEKSLVEIEKQRDDPKTSEDQRRRLEKLAEEIQQMIERTESENTDRQAWQRITQSDEARALLQAIAKGEAIPDQQWNKLLSTLDDGLRQVRGKQPPEAYRKAIEQYQDQIRELMQTIDEG